MEFENDIFISYAHIDNETLSEEQKGWISAFHRALEVRLGQLLGKKPNIFRDPKLQGNDVFGDRLVEALPKTAALVSIISPRYVRSDWCLRELLKFVEAAQHSHGLRLGTKSRIFKIVKTPIPFEKHPEPVQDLLGYEFFSVDQATGRPTELSQDAPGGQQQYWAKLNDLAYDLCEILEGLEGAAASAVPAPRAAAALPAAGATVFLAETSHDLRDERDSLMRLLQQHGHTVLPDCALPLVADECAEMLREQLARCRMSIHLVGANYGIVPEGTSESLVALQNEIAIERGSADAEFQRLIWMPPGLTPGDDRQQKLIETLRNDSRIQHGADILETPIAELKLAIREKLEPPPAKPSDKEAIFLAVTSHDLRAEHDRLKRFLAENGHPILPESHHLPLVAGECESYLREQLARCRMSIHLVGVNYGVVPDATTQSLVTIQSELALARGSGDDQFQQLVWMPPELSTEDPRQLSFLEKLRAANQGRVAILETSIEDLERTILEKLAPPTEKSAEADRAAVSAQPEGPAMIYLICEQRDVDNVALLEDYLFDQGCEVVLPLFEGDEAEIREEHEESLRLCDAVLIYYGAANEGWQRRMLREVKKGAGYGRRKPAPAVAIYVAPPETPQKKRLRTQEALVLRPQGEFSPEDLKPLLGQLGSAPTEPG